jgi:hypothetical protein
MSGRRTTLTTPAEPGSLYDIIRRKPHSSLFLSPARWTDHHVRVLGASFIPQSAINGPVYEGKARFRSSDMAEALILDRDTLLSQETPPERAYKAIHHVMSTFFHDTLGGPQIGTELNLRNAGAPDHRRGWSLIW